MIQSVAVVPPEIALSSLGALLAPVLLIAISAVLLAFAGMLIGIVSEWRDGTAQRRMAAATWHASTPDGGPVRRAA